MSESRKSQKTRLRSEMRRLASKRKGILTQIQELETKLYHLREEYQPEIDRIQAEADALARKFRRLYRESQDAYEDGEGELAKEFSEEGHEAQEQCEELNEEANALRSELKELADEIAERRDEANHLREQITEHKRSIEEIYAVPVCGFMKSGAITDRDVEDILDELPEKLAKEVISISFHDSVAGSITGVRLGKTSWEQRTGRAIIDVYCHPFKDVKETEELEEDYRKTVAHELGHVMFQRILTPEQRWQWGEWYLESMREKKFITKSAGESRDEDFSECFLEFAADPRNLESFDKRRYSFIKEAYELLEQENNNEET